MPNGFKYLSLTTEYECQSLGGSPTTLTYKRMWFDINDYLSCKSICEFCILCFIDYQFYWEFSQCFGH